MCLFLFRSFRFHFVWRVRDTYQTIDNNMAQVNKILNVEWCKFIYIFFPLSLSNAQKSQIEWNVIKAYEKVTVPRKRILSCSEQFIQIAVFYGIFRWSGCIGFRFSVNWVYVYLHERFTYLISLCACVCVSYRVEVLKSKHLCVRFFRLNFKQRRRMLIFGCQRFAKRKQTNVLYIKI